jgi:hypothetical protein
MEIGPDLLLTQISQCKIKVAQNEALLKSILT